MPNLYRIYHRLAQLGILIVISYCFCPQAAAQSWPWLTPVSGVGSETISGIVTRASDGPVICGHFQNELSIGNILETAEGNTDAFVAALDATGQEQWIFTASGAGADKSTDVSIDAENNIYWAGEYWFDGTFGSLTISTTKSSKAIFLLRMTNTGALNWISSIEGTGNKTLGAMTTDEEGNSYLTGNFSDSLFVENNVVLTATAEKDFFMLKFSPTGDFLWAKQAGIEGEIQPKRMRHQNDLIAVTGSMRGQYDFGTDTIQNNTNDSDAFLVVYNADGTVNWARKIGGVNDQNGSDIAFDNNDNIYAVGNFYGLIRLRTDLEIQSPNLNDNLYFIKYDLTGFPLLARSIGDLEIELSESLVFTNDRFYWSGFFKNSFNVDGFSLEATGDNFNSFILEIDTTAMVEEAYLVTSPETVLLAELVVDEQGQIFCGGALNGTATFNDQAELMTVNGFDSFVGQLTPLIVGTNEILEKQFKIYPNPTTEYFTIESPLDDLEIRVFTINGIEILKTNERVIDCRNWTSGLYILKDNFGSSHLLMKR